ncbi:MAG: DUF4405 domain-containing protein [Nitrospiraceae bacterium]|nr:DUF4405 domain-containing protein [Nitrospiraceae bacterium]
MTERKFHTKGFISLLTALSTIFMTISGIVLYFVPAGRIAYWTKWKFFFLTKENWIDMHVLTSLLFIIGAVYHIYLNWAVFTTYIVKKAERVLSLKKEMAIASVITAIFVIASIYTIPPLNYVIKFSDYLKNSWVTSKELEPPFGHAELLSLKSFAKKMDMDLNLAVEELKKNGFKIESSNDSIEKIAKNHNTSPLEIYKIIKKYEKKDTAGEIISYTPEQVDEKFAGTGLGRKTLKQIIEENKLDINKAKKKLSEKNIQTKEGETLKQAADRHNTTPIDIMKIILVDEKRNR